MQSSTTSSTSNQWVHLTLSVDESNSNVKFYQNGNLINTFNNMPLHMNNSIGGDTSSKSKYWKLRTLSLTKDTSYKIVAGDPDYAKTRVTHYGTFRITELALSDETGEFIEPSHIKVSNSEGETQDPVPTLQDNVYNANQFNGVFNGLLQDYLDVEYTFPGDIEVQQIHIGATSDPQSGGFPIDMELYQSSDGTTWVKHSSLTYNTGDIKDIDNNDVNIYMYHTYGKHIVKYLKDDSRWYFDSIEGGSGSTQINYTQEALVENPYIPPKQGGGLGSLEDMLIGSSIMTNSAFKGSMDDVTIHEDTLTDEQVNAVYNASLNSVVPTIPLNQWSHIAVNHNIHKKQLDMYLNGELCGVYGNFNGNIETNTNEIKLGEGFVGEMSETVLFQRPLTETEIKALASDPKRHQKGKGLISANFASVEPMSTTSILNKSAGESNLELRSTASYKLGHESGARALEFNGTQMGTLNLSDDGFIFDTMVLQSKLKLASSTGSHQSIVRVPGVFDWYVGADGKPTLTMDGDSTEYKMNNVLQNNKFSDLKLEVNKYKNKITFTDSGKFGWVLIQRDVVGQSPNTSLANVGTLADAADITKPFGLLGDMANGVFDTDEYKSGGTYLFRMIPYGSVSDINNANDAVETYNNVPFGSRYFQWSQTENPTTTQHNGDAGFNDDITVVPDEYKDLFEEYEVGREFEGLALSGEQHIIWLDGQRNSGQTQYSVGYVHDSAQRSDRQFMYGPTEYRYKHPKTTELWIWMGPKVPTKPELPNFTPTLTLPQTPENTVQLTEFEQKFGTGWQQIKYLPGDSETWFPGNDNLQGYPGDEFLFTTGDFSRWMIMDHFQVSGENYTLGDSRIVTKSSLNSSPHSSAIHYHRNGTEGETGEDPWVGYSYNGPGTYIVMYGENSNTYNLSSIHPSGMYVYTRTAPPYVTPFQRSTIDVTLDDGTKQTMEVTTDAVTDADTHKTPWILALNYIHKTGTNPDLNPRDATQGFPVLPIDGSLDFDNVDINGTIDDGSYNTESWGHTRKDLFDKVCKALGSETGNENGIELRFVAKTNNHTRRINFKSHWTDMISEFRVGNQSGGAVIWPTSTYTKYDDHTSYIPSNDSHSVIFNEPTSNDNEMTEFPFYSNGQHWAMRGQGSRWEVDNGSGVTYNTNTYHQIWVRAFNDKPVTTALTEEIENVNINMNSSNVMYIGSNLTGSMSEVNVGLGFHVPPVVDYTQTKMVMNFSFDESSTEVAIDTSAFGNNGTLMNGAVRQYGTYDIQSKGVTLDASQDQYVNIPGAAYSNVSFNTCTMSAWVFTSNDGTSADKKDILKRDGAFEWYIDGSGVVKYMDLNTYEGVTSSITIDDNTWTHLGIVVDEYANNMTFYKDGTLVESIPSALPIVYPMSTNDIQIGKNFTGVMDNVIMHLGNLDITAQTSLYDVPDNSYNPETITENEWAHVACVYKKETNTTTVYHNGQVIGYYNSYLKDFTSVGKNVNSMYIATTGDNATFYDGIIDDVRVYKTALTDEDIAEMFSQYKFYDRYFNIETSLASASFAQNNIVFDIVLNEPAGKAANNSINYFAFPVTRVLNGKSEVEFLLENIDSLNVNLYDTNVYTTAGSAKETTWNVTLTKAISGNLTDEADLSDMLYLHLYVVAKDYEGNVDYIYKQVQVTLPSHDASLKAQITESNSGSEVIALTEGSVISAKQYLVFAFNGQVSLEKAKLFAETHLLPNISTNTGGTMNNVYGHSVYSYKVSTVLPTPAGHLIETGVTLANAFQTTTSSTTTPVPISSSGLFTTYLVSFDATNTSHAITSGYGNINSININSTEYDITVDDVTDVDAGKTPWILVLNYIHKKDTQPNTETRTLETGLPVLPSDGSLDFNNLRVRIDGVHNENYHEGEPGQDSWGHAGNNLFDEICKSLGSSTNAENGLEVRFVAKSSKDNDTARVVHFKSNHELLIKGFRYGNTGTKPSFTGWNSSYSLYSDHTAVNIPEKVDTLFQLTGDDSMLQPMKYNAYGYFWIGKDGNNAIFAVDNYLHHTAGLGDNYNTYHQIWVRANKSGATGFGDMDLTPIHTPALRAFDTTTFSEQVESISFQISTAIKDLSDGTYTTDDTLTYGDTTISSGNPILTGISPGGYIINTDANGNKNLSIATGESFGLFEVGTSNFTLFFVISTKDLTTNRMTFGVNPSNAVNVHIRTDAIGMFPFDYSTTGVTESQKQAYASADYCLMMFSYDKDRDNGTFTTMLQTNTGNSHDVTVTNVHNNISGYGYSSSSSAQPRTFALMTESDKNPIHIYDMMILPEYIDTNSSKFTSMMNYVNSQFFNIPVLQTPPSIPLKVTFDISEPSSTGVVTVSSGEIIVGTQVPISKFVVFAISGNTKGKDVIRSFYNNNLSNIDTSSDTIYVNTTGHALGSTVDLSTLNIALSKMYTGIDGVTETAITAETILMNVYIVTVNLNNEIESVAEGLFPVYDPIDVNYTSLTRVTGANEWYEGAFYIPHGDATAISTDGQFMANTVQYMNGSWTAIAKPGKVYVSKNSAAPGEDYQYKAYQMIEIPVDVGQVLGTSATNVSHVGKVSFSHDGAYLSVAGSNWVLIYKRNDDTNQYEIYDDITPKFTQVTLAYGHANWVPYNYYANTAAQLSATGDYLLVVGAHGHSDGTDDLTSSVWINNGSGFDLYQDGGMKTLRPNAPGVYVKMSGDAKTIVVSGWVNASSGQYQIGFRVYRRNDDTGRYEHTQYARYANYATGTETEENTNETFVAQTGGATTIGETTPTSGWVQGLYGQLSMSYDGKTFVLYGQRNSNGASGLCAVFKLNPDTNIYNHVDNLTMYNSTLGLSYNNHRSGCGNEQGSYYPGYVSLSTDGKYITSNTWNESPGYYIFKYDESAGKYIRQKTMQTHGCVALNNTEAGISGMNPGGSYVIGAGQYVYVVGMYTSWWYLLKPTGTA